MEIPDEMVARIESALIHCVGDVRCCPHCDKESVLDKDTTAQDAWKVYRDLQKSMEIA